MSLKSETAFLARWWEKQLLKLLYLFSKNDLWISLIRDLYNQSGFLWMGNLLLAEFENFFWHMGFSNKKMQKPFGHVFRGHDTKNCSLKNRCSYNSFHLRTHTILRFSGNCRNACNLSCKPLLFFLEHVFASFNYICVTFADFVSTLAFKPSQNVDLEKLMLFQHVTPEELHAYFESRRLICCGRIGMAGLSFRFSSVCILCPFGSENFLCYLHTFNLDRYLIWALFRNCTAQILLDGWSV